MLILFFRKLRCMPPPSWAKERWYLRWWWIAENEFLSNREGTRWKT